MNLRLTGHRTIYKFGVPFERDFDEVKEVGPTGLVSLGHFRVRVDQIEGFLKRAGVTKLKIEEVKKT